MIYKLPPSGRRPTAWRGRYPIRSGRHLALARGAPARRPRPRGPRLRSRNSSSARPVPERNSARTSSGRGCSRNSSNSSWRTVDSRSRDSTRSMPARRTSPGAARGRTARQSSRVDDPARGAGRGTGARTPEARYRNVTRHPPRVGTSSTANHPCRDACGTGWRDAGRRQVVGARSYPRGCDHHPARPPDPRRHRAAGPARRGRRARAGPGAAGRADAARARGGPRRRALRARLHHPVRAGRGDDPVGPEHGQDGQHRHARRSSPATPPRSTTRRPTAPSWRR